MRPGLCTTLAVQYVGPSGVLLKNVPTMGMPSPYVPCGVPAGAATDVTDVTEVADVKDTNDTNDASDVRGAAGRAPEAGFARRGVSGFAAAMRSAVQYVSAERAAAAADGAGEGAAGDGAAGAAAAVPQVARPATLRATARGQVRLKGDKRPHCADGTRT
ncbi:hypothetical protein GCM10010324_03090 [Streptomyces hiroshimensis]|uniref:Uncharacterized protein n=1 Tax=Streptomyces hiroshimensis TaxID=66424 RepID=A0ABQ2Y4E3_9ACTN|nr:hypothetical protein GCM10010324_03090 [Streptomyces hiroshimensis]